MNSFQSIDSWSRTHHPKWLDIVRIMLGTIIFIKGYVFLQNRDALYQMAVTSSEPAYTYASIYPRALTLIVAGLLIAVGLITRIACLFELPWAMGAVMFANKESGFFSDHVTGLAVNIIILMLVILFLIEGSGPWSVDASMRKNKERDTYEEDLDRKHLPHL